MQITAARYAAVTSTLALVIALGGTSYAAVKIGTKQLKDNAVTSAKVKNGAITGADVKDHSITGKDVNGYTIEARTADTATYAADAGTVGGQLVQPVHTTEGTTPGRPHFVYVSDTGLDIELRCSDVDGVDLLATTSASTASIMSVVVNDQVPPQLKETDKEDGLFTKTDPGFDLLTGLPGDIAQVTFTYSDADHLVQGTLFTDYTSSAAEPCSVNGYITSTGQD